MSKGTHRSSTGTWTPTQGYILAVICLVIGIALGYFIRGSATGDSTSASVSTQAAPSGMGGGMGAQPTPEQLKHMADKQAEPLLAQLKQNPNDPSLMAQIGNIYYDTQSYAEAINYYNRSLAIAPKNTDVRTDLATAIWYAGNADGALAEFDKVLQIEPNKAHALFNRGVVKWQGKMDTNGAIADWELLLKTTPNYENRANVEEMIARARQHADIKPGTKTDKPASTR